MKPQKRRPRRAHARPNPVRIGEGMEEMPKRGNRKSNRESGPSLKIDQARGNSPQNPATSRGHAVSKIMGSKQLPAADKGMDL